MRRLTPLIGSLCVMLAVAASASARTDIAQNILPPGQYGGLPQKQHSTDQLPLYDALTPLRGAVSMRDIFRLFKPENFRPIGASTREATGRPGLTILRDRFGVPHIYGKTRGDAWYGAGLVAGEDRGLLLELGRNPARAAVVGIPGVDAFSLVTGGGVYVPSQQADNLVHGEQQRLVEAYGGRGRQMLRDFDQYAAGVTVGMRRAGFVQKPWTRDDVIAIGAFIGSIFGNGGGAEVNNADFLARLQDRLGARTGLAAWHDLMQADDPEAPTTTALRFPYGSASGGPTSGSPRVDAHSQDNGHSYLGTALARAAGAMQPLMSNFLVVGANRSATGDPLAVMGPQLGYYYPQIVLEADLHAPGLQAQGALVPGGGPYVLIGRTREYAWSLTSASNDNQDEFLERLCNPDGSTPTRDSDHYVYKRHCRAMGTFDAGTLNGRPVSFHVTVHGPVQGTVTVNGRPYAVALERSTYGREVLSQGALHDMTLGDAWTVDGFYRSANQFGFTFNWAYISHRHVAYFSSGLLPQRAPGLNRMLPTLGTGPYDWRGFLSLGQHPHQADPPGGLFLNWNNKPAPGWIQGDNVHSYGPVHRVQLFFHFPRRVTLRDDVAIMNRAATQDLRAVQVWPVIASVLRTGPAPDARTAEAARLVSDWVQHGASRLDRNLDGRIDDPGAAVMDRAWVPLATTVLGARIGSLTDDLSSLVMAPDAAPYHKNGSSFGDGWYGYVQKDLRTLLGQHVRGRFALRYCGRGSLSRCRASLYAAIKLAADQLASEQGTDPRAWRSDATKERIRFQPGLISNTMRWTNRSTFQQVIEFVHPPTQPSRRPQFTG